MRSTTVVFSPRSLLAAIGNAGAVPVVLQEYSAPGCTFCGVADTFATTDDTDDLLPRPDRALGVAYASQPVSLTLLAFAGEGMSLR